MLNCFFPVAAPFYTFSTALPTLVIFHLLVMTMMMMAILVDTQWDLMVFICVSLMTNDAEHLFMCLLSICISSLEKCLFISFAHF